MKLKSISIRVKRDVRHRNYVNSQIDCTLTADLELGEDLRQVKDDLYSDITILLEEMETEERRYFKS